MMGKLAGALGFGSLVAGLAAIAAGLSQLYTAQSGMGLALLTLGLAGWLAGIRLIKRANRTGAKHGV